MAKPAALPAPATPPHRLIAANLSCLPKLRSCRLHSQIERALALRMAKALLTAEAIGRKAALALTAAKARDLHKELFSDSAVTEHRVQVNDIAEAMVPDAAFEEAKAICAGANTRLSAAEAEAAAEAEE